MKKNMNNTKKRGGEPHILVETFAGGEVQKVGGCSI